MTLNTEPGRCRLRRILLLVFIASGMLLTSTPAHAVGDGNLGIRPEKESDFFHLALYPGAALEDAAIVSNFTDEPVTLRTYPVDGQSSPDGTFAFAAETDPRSGVGAWVSLEADSITVPAKSELRVPFRISVPDGTPPGDYAGGLIIESPPVEGETSIVDGTAVRLDVVQRLGVRIYFKVEGTAVKSLDHGELTWEKTDDNLTFTLPLHNTGNVILHPTADLDLKGVIGVDTEIAFRTPESILPGARVNLEATLAQAPAIQVGNAEATLSSEAGTAQVETNMFYAPWLLISIMALTLALLVFGGWRLIRFIRIAREAIAQAAPANRTAEPAPFSSGRRRG